MMQKLSSCRLLKIQLEQTCDIFTSLCSESNLEVTVAGWIIDIVSSRGWFCSVAICPGLLLSFFTTDLCRCTMFSDFSIWCCLCHAFGRPSSWICAVICTLQHETVIQIIASFLRTLDKSSDAKWHVVTFEILISMMMSLWNIKKYSKMTKMQIYMANKWPRTR